MGNHTIFCKNTCNLLIIKKRDDYLNSEGTWHLKTTERKKKEKKLSKMCNRNVFLGCKIKKKIC